MEVDAAAPGSSIPGTDAALFGSCGTATPGAVHACATYAASSIAAVRNPPAPGCYELAHVGLVARTDSPSAPRIYVQDQTAGDFSAILAKCSSTSAHMCSPSVRAKIPRLTDSLTTGAQISVRGYYSYGKYSGFEEFYVEDIVDECATLPRPAPIALSVGEIARDARVAAKWFQRANVDVPAQDPLVMYEFSPPELQLPLCPNFVGFGMIPKSAAAPIAAGCSGSINPPSGASDPREILFGREFFKKFLYSSDCACAAAARQRLVTPSSSVSGAMLGYLIIEERVGTTMSFQTFEPAADKTFPIQ